MTPFSVLVLSHEFPPLGGGAGRIMRALCEELHKRGCRVCVWTSAPLRKKKQAFPFPVRYFPVPRRAQFKTSPLALFVYLAEVVGYGLLFHRENFDVVFSNSGFPAGIAGAIIFRRFSSRHTVLYHNTEITQNRLDGAGLLFRAVFRFVAHRAVLNLFVSESLQNLAQTYGTFRGSHLLPNAARISVPSLPLDPRPPYCFLFTGRIEPVKNPFVFLDAIDILAKRGSCTDARFRIVGGGSLYNKVRSEIIRRRLGNLVSCSPSVDAEEMPAVYHSVYALVIPSTAEGFPTTVLEAAAFGIPAIGSAVVGNRDAIIHEKTGLLFDANNSGQFAAAMERLVKNPHLRNTLGINARDMERQYTVERTADIFMRLVEEFTGKAEKPHTSRRFSCDADKMRKLAE